MADTNVAQDQIKAYVDRILRMKEEAKAINADIREIYAEAKGNGFDKTVLGQLVSYVEKRQTDAATLAERSALFDLYLEAFDGSSGRPSHAHTRERASTLTYGDHLDDATKAAVDPVSALRADPAMAIVDVANLKTSAPQPAPQAGSDLTTPQAPQAGQVASHPEAKASTDGGATEQDIETPADSVTGDASRASVGAGSDVSNQPETANDDRSCVSVLGGLAQSLQQQATREGEAARPLPPTNSDAGKSVEASASAAPRKIYAAPGVVTWEHTPPEGVKRHDYSYAFGDLGQDSAVIEDDLANAAAEPIVKIGPVILDGWARYIKTRSMVALDGKPVEYSVVQYAGTDPLMDCIRWNLAGRILNDAQKRTVAQRLARLEPGRKDEIYAAMELGMELVA